jgi:membrane protein
VPRMRAWFFEGELPERPWALRQGALLARLLGLAAMRFHRDRGQEKAGALAYSTLLALIPFLLLAASLVEFLQPKEQTDVVAWFLRAVFPPEAQEVREGVLDYVQRSRGALETPAAAGTSLRIAGAIMLIWFAVNLMTGIDRVVGDIWGTGGIRVFVRRLASYWAVLTLAPFLLALSIAGTALLKDYAGEFLGKVAATLLPFVVTWTSALAFFRLMPHTSVRFSAAVVGAVVAGTLFELTKLLMGWYLGMPKSFLTALSFFPAAILWMYVSWTIAIYGLEVTYVAHHGSWRAGRRAGRRELVGTARDEMILAVAVETARGFDEGRTVDLATLADGLRAGEDEVARALKALRDAGLVTESGGGGFRPARGASGTKALAVLDASRTAPGTSRPLRTPPGAAAFLAEVDAKGRDAVADVTLEDLVRKSLVSTT